MAEERAKYGYCPKCAEPFDRPYTHCPFCNEVNPHLEKDLQKSRENADARLKAQLEASRQWVDANRAEVKMQVDAQIEQNLREMNQQIKDTTGAFTKGKAPLLWLLIIGGIALLVIGLWLLLK